MGRMVNGVLVGFGSALSVFAFASWQVLVFSVSQGFLIVGEADFVRAVEVAANFMIAIGILLIVIGISMELYQRWKRRKVVEYPP